jgi:delta14-sterol reductase
VTHFIREDFMLSTWDIIAENFGFMLVWGDMVYLPFLYCIGGWYVAAKPESSDSVYLVFIILVYVLSHAMYRNANW